jgi:hypothetical protein
MKDATVGALSRVPAQVLPAVPMATPVDPIFTAIERDRIAFVAFAASLSKTDGRKAAQEKGREVTQTDEDAHEAASGVGDDVGPGAGLSSHSRSHRVSRFRGLPQRHWRYAELSALRLAKPSSKTRLLARTRADGERVPVPHRRWSRVIAAAVANQHGPPSALGARAGQP